MFADADNMWHGRRYDTPPLVIQLVFAFNHSKLGMGPPLGSGILVLLNANAAPNKKWTKYNLWAA